MSTNTPVANRWSKHFPVALIVLSVGLILSYLVIVPPPALTRSSSVTAANENGIQRGRVADTARYNAMAKLYAAQSEIIQLGRVADTARYTAMAEFYAAKEAASIQRGRDADAARYNAMAEYYMKK